MAMELKQFLLLQVCNFIKMELQHRFFPVNFAKLLRTTFLQNTFGRLLLENELDFSSSAIFVIVHPSAMNLCEYDVVLKGQEFQDKHHARSAANFTCRNLKAMTLKALSKIPEDMLDKAKLLYLYLYNKEMV